MTKLKELRIKSGYCISAIAEKLNVTNQSIYNYESGKRNPNYKTLKKLAEIYGCKIDDLID